MVVLALVGQGKWALDEPLSNYWVDPDLKSKPELAHLTTRMVLRHLSGLPNSRGGGPLAFSSEPGAQQSYSGEGFRYLRRAIEAKYGRSFQSMADEYVFDPAGMTQSTFAWPADNEARVAGKFYGDFEFDVPKGDESNIVGGLYATTRDLGRFLVWMNNDTGLSDELWAELATPNDIELLSAPEEDPRRHGLSWVIYDQNDLTLTHGGNEMGVRAYIAILPDRQSGLAVVVNGSGGVPLIRAIFEATLKQHRPMEDIEAEFERWDSFDQ